MPFSKQLMKELSLINSQRKRIILNPMAENQSENSEKLEKFGNLKGLLTDLFETAELKFLTTTVLS